MSPRFWLAGLVPALFLALSCASDKEAASVPQTPEAQAASQPQPSSAPAPKEAPPQGAGNGGIQNPSGLVTSPLFTRGIPSEDTRATIKLAKGGNIVLRFYPKEAPIHVSNFIHLAEKGFYDGLKFHRVVPGFVIQGGDPAGNGTGGPGWNIKAEFNKHPHQVGALAMARSASPDSGGSQFYICLGAPSFLDGQYTVFGQAVEGQDLVNAVQMGDVMEKVTIQY